MIRAKRIRVVKSFLFVPLQVPSSIRTTLQAVSINFHLPPPYGPLFAHMSSSFDVIFA
jgi:hypothetical protein